MVLRNETQDCVHVKVSVGNIASLGIAYFGQTDPAVNIIIKSSITNDFDLLFATIVHEYYHLLGFGDQRFRSFVEYDESGLLVYTSERVRQCMADYTDETILPVERLSNNIGAHWDENAPNHFSLLKPFIDGNSRLAECSVVAAAELTNGMTSVCNPRRQRKATRQKLTIFCSRPHLGRQGMAILAACRILVEKVESEL